MFSRANKGRLQRALKLGASTWLVAAQLVLPAGAGPENGVFSEGTGNIAESAPGSGVWSITASDGAIIDYTGFNVGSSESVTFVQPGATSRVLNRIASATPTRIDGAINANGRVYFVNPAGVLIGSGATVNVGGLFAAAAELSNEDFLASIDQFVNAAGTVENRGTIVAGLVHLFGLQVANYGSIQAPAGLVTMTAGQDLLLTTPGSPIVVQVTGGAAPVGEAGVLNEGDISAAAGRVVLSAGDVYAFAVNHPGNTTASDVQVDAGAGQVALANGAIEADGSISINGGAIAGIDAPDGDAELRATGGAAILVNGSAIDLEVESNGGSVSVAATGNAALRDTGSLALASAQVDGNLTVIAGGALSDTAEIRVGGDARFGGDQISLDELDVAGAIGVDSASSADIVDRGDLVLAQSDVVGDLDATAIGGAIRDSGAVSVGGIGTFRTQSDTNGGVVLDAAGTAVTALSVRTSNLAGSALVEAPVKVEQDADLSIVALHTLGSVSIDAGNGDVVVANPVGQTELLRALALAGGNLTLHDIATVDGQTYTSNGGFIRLRGALETVAAGNVTFNGPVLTTGNAAIGTTGQQGGLSRGNVTFSGTVDGPGSLFITVRPDAQVLFADKVGATSRLGELRILSAGNTGDLLTASRAAGIVFGGSEVHAQSILLNVPFDVNDPVRRADVELLRPTIVGTGSRLEFDATGLFEMAAGERLSVAGPLLIRAGNARLSDLAAFEIDVLAPVISIHTRPAGFVELAPGGNTVNDQGVDFVANRIAFQVTPRLIGSGPQPFFVTPSSNELSGTLQFFRRRQFATVVTQITAADLFSDPRYFDLTGTGPAVDADGTVLALDAVFGGYAWRLPPVVAESPIGIIGTGPTERLRGNRPLQGVEVLAFLSASIREGGSALFGGWNAGRSLGLIESGGTDLQLIASVAGLPAVSSGDLRVSPDAAHQLDRPEADSALRLYQRLQDEAPEMSSKIEQAIDAYQKVADRGAANERALASFLSEDVAYAEVVKYLGEYAELLRMLEGLYLSEGEFAGLKQELLRDVTPEGVSAESLVRAISLS